MSTIEIDANVPALLTTLIEEVRAVRISIESKSEPSPLLTREQLASLLQLDERTIRRLELAGQLPPSISIGAAKRWRRSDIDKWLAERGAT